MSKVSDAFKNGKAFIGFVVAGDPSLEKTEEYVLELVRAGTDIIEIGIPFSDPVAEGPVIQAAAQRALNAGTTPEKIFDLVKSLRRKTDVALVFLTYINPIFNYGYEAFFAKCSEVGLNGLVIPDMPYEERGEIAEYADKYGVDLIPLVAPTSVDRIKRIAAEGTGFIYVVSSMGVTGVRSEITTDLDSIIKVVRSATDTPVAVGFGINTTEQAEKIAKIADGVIVGSAIVKLIEKHKDNAAPHIYEYAKKMKTAAAKNN